MKIRIENGAGRHLGTFEAQTNVDAAEQLAHANGYNGIEEAESESLRIRDAKTGQVGTQHVIPFFKMDRLEFITEAES